MLFLHLSARLYSQTISYHLLRVLQPGVAVSISKSIRRKSRMSKAKKDISSSSSRIRLDLPRFAPYRITVLASLVRRRLATIYADDPGLTEPEWKVMTTLAHFGPMSSADVRRFLTLDRVAVSRALLRLIEFGFVARTENLEDQRMSIVRLTETAERVYDRMAREALTIEADILADLDAAERKMFLKLLERIEARMREEDDRERALLMKRATPE
jgi:DNA-binding MarR family transcriptional regulator